MLRWRPMLDAVATALMIAASAAILWATLCRRAGPAVDADGRMLHVPPQPLSLQGAALRGDPKAPVCMIVYTDSQCPFCRAFAISTLPSLMQEYVTKGRVLLAVRQVPLEAIHDRARAAAQAAVCAGREGRFWAMHDQLFVGDRPLDDEGLIERAHRIGLAPMDFAVCLHGDAARASVQLDLSTAHALGVNSTPAFHLGTIERQTGRVRVERFLSGAAPLAAFRKVLDELLVGTKG